MNQVAKMPSIIHCDMDAFYASVEQLSNPELRGKPVIIGGNPKSRGVVSTCSYEARKFGIRSAMPLAEAYRLCPHAIFLPPDFSKYKQASKHMHMIFQDYTPLIEPISLDEAFLDVTASLNLFGTAEGIGREIKQRIKQEIGLTVSVGIAHNKFLAKLASDLSKPDGFKVISKDRVLEVLDPLDVRRIWGVGEKTAHRLYSLNLRTIKDVRLLDKTTLHNMFGSLGNQLHLLSRGIDQRPVESGRAVKSVGRETTFAIDIFTYDKLERVIMELSVDVGRTLRRAALQGRTVTLKVKYNDFKTITRSKTLELMTNLDDIIYNAACELLQNTLVKPVRLIGVSVHNLTDESDAQLSLFEIGHENQSKLARAMDLVRDKFGEKSITRARLLNGIEADGTEEKHLNQIGKICFKSHD